MKLIGTNCDYLQEIDYTQEAANAELFASNFKNMDYVKVPKIFWEYTTPQVRHFGFTMLLDKWDEHIF